MHANAPRLPDLPPYETVMERHAANTEQNTRQTRNVLFYLAWFGTLVFIANLVFAILVLVQFHHYVGVQDTPACVSQGGTVAGC